MPNEELPHHSEQDADMSPTLDKEVTGTDPDWLPPDLREDLYALIPQRRIDAPTPLKDDVLDRYREENPNGR